VLAITLADLRYRSRQFLIAVVGAGLVFAMALLLTGLADSFRKEIDRTVASVGAEAWILPAGTAGPFTGFSAMPDSTVAAVAALPGVTRADPMVVIPANAVVGGVSHPVRVIGHREGGLGTPHPYQGRVATTDGEAVVDARLRARLGDTLTAGGRRLTVVGTVRGQTMGGGIPSVFVTVKQAQASSFGGQPLVTVIVTRGRPAELPPGLIAMSNAEVRSRSMDAMRDAITSLDQTRALMWLIAALIVAALVYVSTLQRAGDLSVLKAIGSSTRALVGGVALQAIVVASVAALLAAGLADRLRPMFPLPIEISAQAYLLLPVAALVVGLLASLAGIRQTVTADPARAFT
jgi:putative ABC transport system permease protein